MKLISEIDVAKISGGLNAECYCKDEDGNETLDAAYPINTPRITCVEECRRLGKFFSRYVTGGCCALI